MSFFHYATYKYVTIRDSRLGIGYYITAALIVTFTLVEIFISKGYLEYDTNPVGTLRLILSDPDQNFFHDEQPPECCINKTSDGKCISQCHFMDAQELSWPIQSRTLSVMTFCKERWQSNRQSSDHPEEFVTLREQRFYTLKPEEYVVKVEHSIIASKFFGNSKSDMIAGSQRAMKGWLYDVDGSQIREIKEGADKLTIRELFSAAGVGSLEQVSDALNAKGKTYRRHGLVLHVTIKYTNVHGNWFGAGPIQYGYHVSRIPYADYRVNELTPIFNGLNENLVEPKSRVLRKRYGIKIEFHQAGMLGNMDMRFSFRLYQVFQVVAFCVVIQGALSIPRPKLNDTDEYRLLQMLFGGYNMSSVRPVKNSSKPVQVEFQMKLSRLVKVDSREMTLVTDVWITQKWMNPFLTWDPKKYGGIKIIHAQPKDVWVPDTALINNAESDFAGSRTKYKTLVVLKHDGESIWMSPATFISSCRFDVSAFPFDTQLCDMKFGSWTFTENKLILAPLSKTDLFADTRYESGDWTIPSMKLEQSTENLQYADDKFARITYKLKLERKPVYFIMYLIVPTVLISLLVLFSFKIPVDSGERIGLCTTALLSMSVFLLLIGEHLPESSENIPLLAIASVLMMIEITMGFLATIVVLKCHHNTTKPPKILKVLCCIKQDKLSPPSIEADELDPNAKQPTVHALLQAQMSMVDNKEDKYQQEWKKISKTMDRIFFYLFLSTLVGTLAGVYLMAPFIVKLERDL